MVDLQRTLLVCRAVLVRESRATRPCGTFARRSSYTWNRLTTIWLARKRNRGSHCLTKVPSLNYLFVAAAFQLPAHKPIKRSTPAKLLADAELPLEEFLALL